MRKLLLVGGVVVMRSAFAADYFFCAASKDAAGFSAPYAVWAPVDQTAENPKPLVAPVAGTDNYWIISDFSVGTNAACSLYIRRYDADLSGKGIYNLGSPAGKVDFPSRTGTLAHGEYANAGFTVTRMNWYNGSIYNHQGGYSVTFSGTYVVMGDGSHEIRNSHNDRLTHISAALVSESDDALVNITCANNCSLTAKGYVYLCGDNTGYRGTFSLDKVLMMLYLGGNQPLGSPDVPNPAALKVCDQGVFGLAATCAQSANRGVRLVGASAYYKASADGLTFAYPISKAEGVAGKLIKYDAFTDTFDGAYSAGDLEIQNGTLVLGPNPTFHVRPDGELF